MQKFVTKSAEETQKLGKNFAKSILSSAHYNMRSHISMREKSATVVCLRGDLGGGKTTFLQGFAKGLQIKEKILSPTFVIMKHFANFYHFDCYRINKPEEILELGFKKIILDPKNIVAIEWPEKIGKLLPKNSIKIKFKVIDEKTRELTFKK
ncbi:MAG: tRNA (adenosine(37)-N6)-threonylcarbamoyltransferase complex ATPase subunit type 1 TsaE [Patescibacteria group bacterium]